MFSDSYQRLNSLVGENTFCSCSQSSGHTGPGAPPSCKDQTLQSLEPRGETKARCQGAAGVMPQRPCSASSQVNFTVTHHALSPWLIHIQNLQMENFP